MHHLLIDGGAKFGGGALHHHADRFGADSHCFGRRPDVECDLFGKGLVDIQFEDRERNFFKAALFDGQDVIAGKERLMIAKFPSALVVFS